MAVPEKVIATGNDARNKLIKGALFLADTVKQTLGPYGANALIEKGNRVTNDGVTIAREIRMKDEIEHLGAHKVQEVASKTNDEAGDGTTTAITLAGAILTAASKYLAKDTIIGRKTPIEVIMQIEQERKEITDKLVAMAIPVDSEEKLIEIAKVSVEDDTLGELIGKAQWELGPDGFLLAEETNERESSIDRISGIRVDNGFGTSAIINNQEKESFEVENVKVVYTNNTIKALSDIVHVLDPLLKSGAKDIVIVARAFTQQAITECIKNTQQGFHLYPLNAPYTDQAEIMKDLEAILGGTFINADENNLSNINISDVGFASKIVAKRSSTVFTGVDDDASKQRILDRISMLEQKIAGSPSDFEKKNLTLRIAQLKNGFSIIKVGGTTETERKYKADKAEDAVNAVRAALQEGVVPGAGQAFKTISDNLPDTYILKQAIRAPYEQIVSSAPPDFTVPDWVNDPVKVMRIALEKACSVASTLSTSSIAIAQERPKARYMQEVDNGDSEED